MSRLYLVPDGKAGDEGYICGHSGEKMACCSWVEDGPSLDGSGIGCYCSEEDGGCKCIIMGGGRATSGINWID